MFNPSHKQGWLICTLYNPVNGDRVQINDIDHAISGIGWEEITNELASSRSQSGWDVLFRIGSTQFEGIELIEEWVTNKTPINAVVAGGKNVQWYENVPLEQFKRQTQADRRGGDQRWSAALSFAGGYNMKIYNNVNLLHQTNVAGKKITGWHDNDGDNKPDGYTVLSAESFINNVFKGSRYHREVYFPIEGIELTTSVDVIGLWGNSANYTLQHSFFAVPYALVNTDKYTVTTTGRIAKNVLLLATTVRCFFFFQEAPGAGTYPSSSYPAVRTDGSPEYIAG